MIKTISCIVLAANAFLASQNCLAGVDDCVKISDGTLRLACYDKEFPRTQSSESESSTSPNVTVQESNSRGNIGSGENHSRMTEDWGLSPDNNIENFTIKPYKPVYLLLGTHTNKINNQPQSDNPVNSVNTPMNGLSSNESQFQISFKTRAWENIFGNNGSLWLGYTQSSRWQVYSDEISRPFRETNYEPEAMLMFRTPYSLGGWNLRMSGIGINHQSNGRANPLSRSWNRIIGTFGIEKDELSVLIRPWIRLKESFSNDNNPGIENYVGRGELIVAQHFGGQVISATARHSLRFGDSSRGSLKIEWAIPISGNLKAYLSAFSGYGESLIDYNHRQTMIGAGVSLVEW